MADKQEPETTEPEPIPDEVKINLGRAEQSFILERIYSISSIYLTVKTDSFMSLPTNPETYLLEILKLFREFGIIDIE